MRSRCRCRYRRPRRPCPSCTRRRRAPSRHRSSVSPSRQDSNATLPAMALEHVAQGQTRFLTPGVAPDPRGVLLGRYCLLTFPTLEGVVSWFRLYSSEASLDELLAGLEITRVRTPLQSREMVIRVPAVSSYACDRAARLTRLVGGSVYTGTTKHFVKYRDDRSPYGYDA